MLLTQAIIRDLSQQTFRKWVEKHPEIPLVLGMKGKGWKQVSHTVLAMFCSKHDSCHGVLWELCPCRGVFYMLWLHLQDPIPQGKLMQEMQYCWVSWCLSVRQQSVPAGHLIPQAQAFWDAVFTSRAQQKGYELVLPYRLKPKTPKFHLGVHQTRWGPW